MITFIVLIITCFAFAKNSNEANQRNEVAFVFGGVNKDEAKIVEVFDPGSQKCKKSTECIPQLPLGLVDAVGIFDGRQN